MKSHSVKSNAKRAARKLYENIPGIWPIEPVQAGDSGQWYPAISAPEDLRERLIANGVDQIAIIQWQAPADGVQKTPIAMAEAGPEMQTRETMLVTTAKPKSKLRTVFESIPPHVPSTRDEILARREERRQRHSAKAEAEAAAPKVDKNTMVLDLIRRPEGATTDEITAATNWLKHSVRRFISVANSKHKMGIIGRREGKVSRYRIPA
ncbi:hypothetical protein BA190_09435 [Labrys sp. WJW]|uniref:DUF3489 domain-containing protein n=1 Tax=Labrys sp. WJW TaxID=1737983 RepID=UPI0008367169|nr:DUF3489 domain-containing protein [Labrys sp. WJW]OCC05128.1 hypothetical protein BA190_09435 [Labrys sp. WJW]